MGTEIQKDRNRRVRQSHALTTSSYNLGRNSKKLLYLSLIQLCERESLVFNDDEGGFEVIINHSEYKNISKDVRDISRSIHMAARELSSNSVIIYTPDLDGDDGEKALISRNWITGFSHEPKNKKTRLFFNKPVTELIPYKKGLPFTQYLLISACNLKNPHSMRLYELICQWRTPRSNLKISIDWLMNRFSLPKSYLRMPDFRSKFLAVAKEEISEHTDIIITGWDEHCEGERKNKVTHITIFWSEKKSNFIDLEAQERQKLETQSNAVIAELIAMEDAILSIEDMNGFNTIMITGYQTTAKKHNYKIPKNVADKIKSLL